VDLLKTSLSFYSLISINYQT